MFCIICGNDIGRGALICPGCGCEQRFLGGTEKFCPQCGAKCHPNALICVKCGCGWNANEPIRVGEPSAAQERGMNRNGHTAVEAALVSFIIPGGGQYLLGDRERGIWIFFAIVVGGAILTLLVTGMPSNAYSQKSMWMMLTYLFLFCAWIAQVADAYKRGRRAEEAGTAGRPEDNRKA